MKKFTLRRKEKKEYIGPIPPVAEMNEETWDLLKRRLWDDFAKKLLGIVSLALTVLTVVSILGFNLYITNVVDSIVEPQINSRINALDTLYSSYNLKALKNNTISNLQISTTQDIEHLTNSHELYIETRLLTIFDYSDYNLLLFDADNRRGIFANTIEYEKFRVYQLMWDPMECYSPGTNSIMREIINLSDPDSLEFRTFSRSSLTKKEWRVYNSYINDGTISSYKTVLNSCSYISAISFVQSSLYYALFEDINDPMFSDQIFNIYQEHVVNTLTRRIEKVFYDPKALDYYRTVHTTGRYNRELENRTYLERFETQD